MADKVKVFVVKGPELLPAVKLNSIDTVVTRRVYAANAATMKLLLSEIHIPEGEEVWVLCEDDAHLYWEKLKAEDPPMRVADQIHVFHVKTPAACKRRESAMADGVEVFVVKGPELLPAVKLNSNDAVVARLVDAANVATMKLLLSKINIPEEEEVWVLREHNAHLYWAKGKAEDPPMRVADQIHVFHVKIPDNDPRSKRQKLDDDPRENLTNRDCKSLRNQLKDQFCNEDGHCTPDFLWDVSLVLTLSHASTGATYSYMGRHVAEALYKKVTALVGTEELTVVGAKGSGKSTIAETLAYYLIVSGKPAVYFSAKSFLKASFVVMVRGLLLAVKEEESALNKLRDWNDIVQWCRAFKNTIYFFVDDYDAFETKEQEKAMYDAIYVHAVICIISTNSDLRIEKLQSDKDREKLQIIDGPYTEDELKTWVSQSSLKVTDECDFWVHLDYWTGGMPGLLKLYEEAEGIPEKFMQFINQSHIQKPLSAFIQLARTSQDLMQCLKFVTEGELSGALPRKKGKKVADLTCFYQDKEFRWHVLCPFLKVKAEAMIVERLRISHIDFGLQSLERWKEVVVDDCQKEHVNRARVGWNVESLVLNVLKCRGYVFKDLLPYSRYVEYLPTERDAIVGKLGESGIRKGVLLIPKNYYEKAIDCLYIHWADDKYMVAGIQISVGGWKAKERKESHLQWNGDVWVHEGAKKGAKQPVIDKKYYYVMPMAANSSGDFEWKKFSDISPLLSFLDAEALKEPVTKEPLKQCEGTTKNDKRCGRWIKDSHCSQHKKGEKT